jgi:hypothetical protein
MSTFQFPASRAGALTQALHEAGFRSPTSTEGTPKVITLTYEPDLTPEEQATFDTVSRLAVGASLLTPEERTLLEPRVLGLRTFRGQSQSEFMAKTANARDRELFDAVNDLAAIVLRLLRD